MIENLKKKKYRDTLGYSNELFQLGGSDFVKAIQMCMNNVKDQHTIQECFKDCNIISLCKAPEKILTVVEESSEHRFYKVY